MNEIVVTVPAEVRRCPACGDYLYGGGNIQVWGEVTPERIAAAVQKRIAEDMESVIVTHYRTSHRLRYWLWRRTAWKRVLG